MFYNRFMNKKDISYIDETKTFDLECFDEYFNIIEKDELFLNMKKLDGIRFLMILYFKEYTIIKEDEEINIFFNSDKDNEGNNKITLIANKKISLDNKNNDRLYFEQRKIKELEDFINGFIEPSDMLYKIIKHDVFDKGDLISAKNFEKEINKKFDTAISENVPDFFILKDKHLLDKSVSVNDKKKTNRAKL